MCVSALAKCSAHLFGTHFAPSRNDAFECLGCEDYITLLSLSVVIRCFMMLDGFVSDISDAI